MDTTDYLRNQAVATTPNSRTTFVVLSDTHNIDVEALPESLKHHPRVDVLLHCGDLTDVGGINAYKKALRLLGAFDAELKLVIAGNHDKSLDEAYWEINLDRNDDPEEHDRAVETMTGELAQEMGVTYLTEGWHSFTLKKGVSFTIYCTPYQPEYRNWAFGYKRSEDRFSFDVAAGTTCIATDSSAIPDNVDIMMTHGPPRGILDFIPSENEHAGCDALLRAVRRVRPLIHCFGHIHGGYGVQKAVWDKGEEFSSKAIKRAIVKKADGNEHREFELTRRQSSLMVNAAIMDDKHNPVHRPWIVELEL